MDLLPLSAKCRFSFLFFFFFWRKVPTPIPHFEHRLYGKVETSKTLLVTLVGMEGASSQTPSCVSGEWRETGGREGGRMKGLTLEAWLQLRKTRGSPRLPTSLWFL